MSWCGCVPKPCPGSTKSSFITRNERKLVCCGSRYEANEKVWYVSSHPWLAWPRSLALRISIMVNLAFPVPKEGDMSLVDM